jgi:hypothetical protein
MGTFDESHANMAFALTLQEELEKEISLPLSDSAGFLRWVDGLQPSQEKIRAQVV